MDLVRGNMTGAERGRPLGSATRVAMLPALVLGLGALALVVHGFEKPTPQDLVMVDNLTAVTGLHVKVRLPLSAGSVVARAIARANERTHWRRWIFILRTSMRALAWWAARPVAKAQARAASQGVVALPVPR